MLEPLAPLRHGAMGSGSAHKGPSKVHALGRYLPTDPAEWGVIMVARTCPTIKVFLNHTARGLRLAPRGGQKNAKMGRTGGLCHPVNGGKKYVWIMRLLLMV